MNLTVLTIFCAILPLVLSDRQYEDRQYKLHPKLKKVKRPYSFKYGVNDDSTGTNFKQHENSDGKKVTGSYSIQLPDGRKQTVNYQADHVNGYKAEVSYQGEAKYPDKFRRPLTVKRLEPEYTSYEPALPVNYKPVLNVPKSKLISNYNSPLKTNYGAPKPNLFQSEQNDHHESEVNYQDFQLKPINHGTEQLTQYQESEPINKVDYTESTHNQKEHSKASNHEYQEPTKPSYPELQSNYNQESPRPVNYELPKNPTEPHINLQDLETSNLGSQGVYPEHPSNIQEPELNIPVLQPDYQIPETQQFYPKPSFPDQYQDINNPNSLASLQPQSDYEQPNYSKPPSNLNPQPNFSDHHQEIKHITSEQVLSEPHLNPLQSYPSPPQHQLTQQSYNEPQPNLQQYSPNIPLPYEPSTKNQHPNHHESTHNHNSRIEESISPPHSLPIQPQPNFIEPLQKHDEPHHNSPEQNPNFQGRHDLSKPHSQPSYQEPTHNQENKIESINSHTEQSPIQPLQNHIDVQQSYSEPHPNTPQQISNFQGIHEPSKSHPQPNYQDSIPNHQSLLKPINPQAHQNLVQLEPNYNDPQQSHTEQHPSTPQQISNLQGHFPQPNFQEAIPIHLSQTEPINSQIHQSSVQPKPNYDAPQQSYIEPQPSTLQQISNHQGLHLQQNFQDLIPNHLNKIEPINSQIHQSSVQPQPNYNDPQQSNTESHQSTHQQISNLQGLLPQPNFQESIPNHRSQIEPVDSQIHQSSVQPQLNYNDPQQSYTESQQSTPQQISNLQGLLPQPNFQESIPNHQSQIEPIDSQIHQSPVQPQPIPNYNDPIQSYPETHTSTLQQISNLQGLHEPHPQPNYQDSILNHQSLIEPINSQAQQNPVLPQLNYNDLQQSYPEQHPRFSQKIPNFEGPQHTHA